MATNKPAAPGNAPPPKLGAPKAGPTPASTAAAADAEAARPAHAAARKRVVVPAQPSDEVPFEQPKMIPAQSIPGARGDRVPPRTRQPGPIKGIRVQAIKIGYYDDKLRRVGDVFTIDATQDADGNIVAFSHNWMVEVAPDTPEKVTGSNAALRREHDGIQGQRLGMEVGRDDVGEVPTGAHNPLGAQ